MINQQVLGLSLLLTTSLTPAQEERGALLSEKTGIHQEVLAEQSLDLRDRIEDDYANEVFKFNILHALEFIGKKFALEPNEVFAFHENIRSDFKEAKVKTSGTKYIAQEGYQAVGGLYGNGVCHLASLMNWVASEAGLEVITPARHDFAPIAGVPREFGTSIRYLPSGGNSQNQNLYIKNNLEEAVIFSFEVEENGLVLRVLKW